DADLGERSVAAQARWLHRGAQNHVGDVILGPGRLHVLTRAGGLLDRGDGGRDGGTGERADGRGAAGVGVGAQWDTLASRRVHAPYYGMRSRPRMSTRDALFASAGLLDHRRDGAADLKKVSGVPLGQPLRPDQKIEPDR